MEKEKLALVSNTFCMKSRQFSDGCWFDFIELRHIFILCMTT